MITALNTSNKKRLLVAIVAISIIGILAGCSKKENPINISMSDIVNTLNQNIDLSDMRNIDAEMFQQFYEIDMEKIEDFALYMASSNVKADEIALIKVKDTSQIQAIKEKVEKRIKDQENKFRDYLPEEYYLVEENILKVKGDFILLAISPDTEKIDTIFSELFK